MVEMVVFVGANRELQTVAEYFKDQDTVDSIDWRDGIIVGATINAGDELADVAYSDNTAEVMVAPAGCSGSIEKLNEAIDYLSLHVASEHLLTVEK